MRSTFEKCAHFLSIMQVLVISFVVVLFVDGVVVSRLASKCFRVSKRALQVFPAETMVDGLPPASSFFGFCVFGGLFFGDRFGSSNFSSSIWVDTESSS